MEANVDHAPLPASLHDVAAVLIVRHLDHHLPEVVVRCLFDSYERVGGDDTVVDLAQSRRVRRERRKARVPP